MDSEPLLPLHLDFIRIRNQRPRSIRERRLAVMRARRRIGQPVALVTRAQLEVWQTGLFHLTAAGMHNEIVHVGQYIKWAALNGHRPDDPTIVLIRPQHIHQDLPRPMADGDVALAIETAGQPERAWISLAAFCGLRCMEIAALTRDVIDMGPPAAMRIYGKGGKVRIVPLPARVLGELLEVGMPRRGPLFQRMDGAPGAPSAGRVSERINKHLHSLGIDHTAHTLRHRFGTALYGRTRDPFLVAQVMGHSSVDTTRGYVQLDSAGTAGFLEAITALAVPSVFPSP
jgi:integrase/recombinase XerC